MVAGAMTARTAKVSRISRTVEDTVSDSALDFGIALSTPERLKLNVEGMEMVLTAQAAAMRASDSARYLSRSVLSTSNVEVMALKG